METRFPRLDKTKVEVGRAFVNNLQSKILAIAETREPGELYDRIKYLRKVIAAGKALGATQCREFEETYINMMIEDLNDLCILGMTDRAKRYVCDVLSWLGMERDNLYPQREI